MRVLTVVLLALTIGAGASLPGQSAPAPSSCSRPVYKSAIWAADSAAAALTRFSEGTRIENLLEAFRLAARSQAFFDATEGPTPKELKDTREMMSLIVSSMVPQLASALVENSGDLREDNKPPLITAATILQSLTISVLKKCGA